MKINFDAAKPIYEQIIEGIKKQIARGELNPGDKLPSQRKMATKAGVNPNTIQRSYREMETRQLVESKRGRGTFVKKSDKVVNGIKGEMANQATIKFIQEMLSLGFGESEIKRQLEVGLEKIKGRKKDEDK